MQQLRVKTIIILSLAGFFLGVMAITLHHHDNSFFLPGCSLCKVKTSFSGTVNKVLADTAPVALASSLSLATILFCFSGILPGGKTVFIDSQIIDTYPNKAPPFTF